MMPKWVPIADRAEREGGACQRIKKEIEHI